MYGRRCTVRECTLEHMYHGEIARKITSEWLLQERSIPRTLVLVTDTAQIQYLVLMRRLHALAFNRFELS